VAVAGIGIFMCQNRLLVSKMQKFLFKKKQKRLLWTPFGKQTGVDD
jgi:hypothetical protein